MQDRRTCIARTAELLAVPTIDKMNPYASAFFIEAIDK